MSAIGIERVAELVGDRLVERAARRVVSGLLRDVDAGAPNAADAAATVELVEAHLYLDGVDGLIDLEGLGLDLSAIVDRALVEAASDAARALLPTT